MYILQASPQLLPSSPGWMCIILSLSSLSSQSQKYRSPNSPTPAASALWQIKALASGWALCRSTPCTQPFRPEVILLFMDNIK